MVNSGSVQLCYGQELNDRAAASKLVATSLRKSMKDIESMTKASTAVKRARDQFEAKRRELENATNKSQASMIGRTNFQKCISATDPPVIQAFKQLSSLRPMPVISKNNPGDTLPLNQAIIVRRGRNTFTAVTKDHKDTIETAMNEFKASLPNQPDNRTAYFG
eukprot:s448_g10.t1